MNFPICTIVLLGLLVGAGAVSLRPETRRASAILSLLTALGALGAVGFIIAPRHGAHVELIVGGAPLLELGPNGLPWVLLPLVVALLAVLALPAGQLRGRSIPAMLLTSAGLVLVALTRNLSLFSAGWMLSVVPAYWASREIVAPDARARVRRTHAVYLLFGAAPLLAALVLLAVFASSRGVATPLDFEGLRGARFTAGEQELLLGLMSLTIGTRMALFPFHSWLPVLLEEGPFAVAVLLASVHSGLIVLTRIVFPLLPEASALAMPILAALALLSALFGSLMAVVEDDLRRVSGFLAVSQVGLIGFGIASMNELGAGGALIESAGAALSMAGVLIMIGAIVARTGTGDLRNLGGLVEQAPRAAGAFLLFLLATVGFPGGLVFVGEDILIHGALEAHPLAASAMLVATALNGITALRTFTRTFLGRARSRPRTAGPLPIEDLLPRERFTLLALAGAVLFVGVFPAALTSTAHRALGAFELREGGLSPAERVPVFRGVSGESGSRRFERRASDAQSAMAP